MYIIISTPPVAALTFTDLHSSIKAPVEPFQDQEIFTLFTRWTCTLASSLFCCSLAGQHN